MDITQFEFCFVSDEYFMIHDKDEQLMKNKENKSKRPSFFAFSDKKHSEILWCVPISSKVDKYKVIVDKKINGQIFRGVKKPECDTIRFGNVMGIEKAFLIQNMFPITKKYIADIYIDKNTLNPVTIDDELKRDIYSKANRVLKLVINGSKNLVFSDILKIRDELILLKKERVCEGEFILDEELEF